MSWSMSARVVPVITVEGWVESLGPALGSLLPVREQPGAQVKIKGAGHYRRVRLIEPKCRRLVAGCEEHPAP